MFDPVAMTTVALVPSESVQIHFVDGAFYISKMLVHVSELKGISINVLF